MTMHDMTCRRSVILIFSSLLLLILVTMTSSSDVGCAYHTPGLSYHGRCHSEGDDASFCSFGCKQRQCWKQCSEVVSDGGQEKRKCMMSRRQWAKATLKLGAKAGCRSDMECRDKIDFKVQESTTCVSGDHILEYNF